MELEIIYPWVIKSLSFIGGLIAIWKVFFSLKKANQKQLKEDYKFAKEFIPMCEKMHEFTKTKGYQALAGSEAVFPNEVEYILTLDHPVLCLKDWVLSKNLFERDREVSVFSFAWKGRYSHAWYRKSLSLWYKFWYFTLAFIALSPIILPSFKGLNMSPEQIVILAMFTIPIGGFYAWACLDAFSKLSRGENLMDIQDKRTSPISSI